MVDVRLPYWIGWLVFYQYQCQSLTFDLTPTRTYKTHQTAIFKPPVMQTLNFQFNFERMKWSFGLYGSFFSAENITNYLPLYFTAFSCDWRKKRGQKLKLAYGKIKKFTAAAAAAAAALSSIKHSPKKNPTLDHTHARNFHFAIVHRIQTNLQCNPTNAYDVCLGNKYRRSDKIYLSAFDWILMPFVWI